jgi:hypothetical protein
MAETAADKIRSIFNRLQQVCLLAVQYACMLLVPVQRVDYSRILRDEDR